VLPEMVDGKSNGVLRNGRVKIYILFQSFDLLVDILVSSCVLFPILTRVFHDMRVWGISVDDWSLLRA